MTPTDKARLVIQGVILEATFRNRFKSSTEVVKWLEIEALPLIQMELEEVYRAGLEAGKALPVPPVRNGPPAPLRKP